ncbi:MAG TPA: protein kinase [Candidatus Sulfotelmatobacter sp.]|nr:protein kinase [Candidatus Sulfotelmatobacter sp.]
MTQQELIVPHLDTSLPEPPAKLEQGTIILDGLELDEVMHIGSNAVVYRAENAHGEGVAVKIFDERKPGGVDTELATHATLNGTPGLVRALSMGITDTEVPQRFVAMELAPTNAEKLVLENGVMPEDVLLSGISQVAPALREMLSARLAHMDVKPRNILVYPETNVWRLTDYGSVKYLGRQTVAKTGVDETTDIDHDDFGTLDFGDISATLGYAPPEVIEARPTPTSDVFELGATIQYLATKELPFGKTTKSLSIADVLEYMQTLLKGDPQPISHLREDFPEEVGRIVRQMLSPTPEDRPSITDVVEALDVAAHKV